MSATGPGAELCAVCGQWHNAYVNCKAAALLAKEQKR